jgi:hypothetical protein
MNSFFTPQLAQEQASGAQAFRHPGAVLLFRVWQDEQEVHLMNGWWSDCWLHLFSAGLLGLFISGYTCFDMETFSLLT